LIQNEEKFSPRDLEAEAADIIALMPQLKGADFKVRALKGGLTNRNYTIDCEGERFVLRVMGENSGFLGINRKAEHVCLLEAHAIGVGPEVIAFFPQKGALVTRFVDGRVLAPKELKSPSILFRVIASLRRYHEKANAAGTFCAFDTVRRYYALGRKRRVTFPRNIHRGFKILERIEKETGVPDRVCHCHNDLLSSNLVDDRRTVWILDWEYGGAGDLFFDLGNLAANGRFDQKQEKLLLKYYFGNTRQSDLERLRFMRLASDMREAMWGFLQTRISKLNFEYQAYATRHYRRFLNEAQEVFRERAFD
jgi:thiamine kinase-like enzyme